MDRKIEMQQKKIYAESMYMIGFMWFDSDEQSLKEFLLVLLTLKKKKRICTIPTLLRQSAM